MAAAHVFRPSYGFQDITNEFFEEAEKLDAGQLIQDPNFTLFQAVGALEIMDPKMDCGLLEPKYERFNAWKPQLPEEIVGIMDRLLCNEMAWHTGSALSQTLFSCLYIDKLLSMRPNSLEYATFGTPPMHCVEGKALIDNILRPYCVSLVKCCGYVNRQVPMENIYEEEDFVSQTYGIPLLQNIEKSDVLGLLESAMKWIQENSSVMSSDTCRALQNRLMLRKSLLEDFARSPDCYHGSIVPHWNTSLELIAEVEKDHFLGKPVDEAWSMSVQRKLASSVPPRPLVEKSFSEAINTVRQLCTEINSALKLLTCKGASNLMTYFINFGARRPTPLPYSRSLIQTLVLRDLQFLGKLSIKEVLFDDFAELCNPLELLLDPQNNEAETPHSPRFQIQNRMQWFVERAGRAYVDLYRHLCQNRPRFRRILCRAVLDWDSLQVESEEVDAQLREFTNEDSLVVAEGAVSSYSFPLSSWVYHYKLRIMEWIMLLGFELEVFQLHEFDGMYWYLQFYLRTRAGHLERIRTFAGERESLSGRYQKTLRFVNAQLLETMAMLDLSTALVHLYAVLARLGLIKKPTNAYGSELLRYECRMKPFLSIGCPEVLPYNLFRSVVDTPDISCSDLLVYASEHISEAKKGYNKLNKLDVEDTRANLCESDYRSTMNSLLRSCFGIGVAIGVLIREVATGTDGRDTLQLVLEKESYHPSFPVPKITAKK